jgi:hypothetical protein
MSDVAAYLIFVSALFQCREWSGHSHSAFVGGYYSVNFQNARCNNKDIQEMFIELRCWLQILKARLKLNVINYTILGNCFHLPPRGQCVVTGLFVIHQLWEQGFDVWRFCNA